MDDFDRLVDRRGTNSIKHEFAKEYGMPEGLVPMWVADMDFSAPEAVAETLKEYVKRGVFGYTGVKEDYFNALHNWFNKRFGFDIKPEWVVKTPGVIFAIAAAIDAFTGRGDGVMIQQPVYMAFYGCIGAAGRKVVNNPLVYENGVYRIDFDDFEQKIIDEKVKAFILCSPHNPVGRVWSAEELKRIGDICINHGCLVVSDEIHCDFALPGHRHHIFGALGEKYLNNSIICTAPSKTFNLAGLQAANIFIADENIRKQFNESVRRTGYGQPNATGLIACQSAYAHCGEWADRLVGYLNNNFSYMKTFINEKIPRVRLAELQGTYLAWLDFKGLKLPQGELERFIVDKAGLWLSGGAAFGEGGEGFMRMNIACPKTVLERALAQLETAVNETA